MGLMRRPSPTYVTLTSGIRLHYRIQGEPGAPWMVMLNGLMSDVTMWAGVLPALAPHFRILTFDGRGQGRSDAPDEPYTPSILAGDAWELFQHLGIQNPWLVGLSNGSSVSLELLATHPGAFAGAVLTSAMACNDFTTGLRIEHWIHCLELGGPELQFESAAPYLWGDRFLHQRYAVLRAYQQVVAGQKPETAPTVDPKTGPLNQMRGALGWNIRDRISAIRDPLFLLAGAEDLMTPPWKCLETANLLPHARFEMVPGVGHAFPVEDAKAFAERVLFFVTEATRN